jgi:hypothetical protein
MFELFPTAASGFFRATEDSSETTAMAILKSLPPRVFIGSLAEGLGRETVIL